MISLENGKLLLENRKKLMLTGVNKIIRFDSEEFVIDTALGNLKVKGKNLTLGKLDNNTKEAIVDGFIDSLIYQGKNKKEESFIKKIFK